MTVIFCSHKETLVWWKEESELEWTEEWTSRTSCLKTGLGLGFCPIIFNCSFSVSICSFSPLFVIKLFNYALGSSGPLTLLKPDKRTCVTVNWSPRLSLHLGGVVVPFNLCSLNQLVTLSLRV